MTASWLAAATLASHCTTAGWLAAATLASHCTTASWLAVATLDSHCTTAGWLAAATLASHCMTASWLAAATRLSLYYCQLARSSHTDDSKRTQCPTQDLTPDAVHASTVPVYLGLGPADSMLDYALQEVRKDVLCIVDISQNTGISLEHVSLTLNVLRLASNKDTG